MGENLTGSTFLGVPGLLNGRTSRAAWAQTSAHLLDDIILYKEYISREGTRYLQDDQWTPIIIQNDHKYTVRGPLMEYNG